MKSKKKNKNSRPLNIKSAEKILKSYYRKINKTNIKFLSKKIKKYNKT
tara:strand:+ start:82 stop:225 length:144 start_codon:yes stop_codon:yes gene_type:complete